VNAEKLNAIQKQIKALDTMPTVPAVILPLMQLLQTPAEEVNLEKVKELVSYDKAIAIQCLRMANSPLFGRRSVETVRDAIVALGIKRIQSIVIGCSLNQLVEPKKWAFDPAIFWRHSLGCALISRKMAQLIGYPDPEKAYLAGLLHDIGILVNSIVCGEEFRKCAQLAASTCVALDKAEEDCLGFNHCQSGKMLADHWHLPEDLGAVVEFHHDTLSATKARSLVSLVHLSDLLCRVRELGYGYYEVMGIDLAGDKAWSILVEEYQNLASMDLARFTMDIDGVMPEIVTLVDTIFATPARA
jgi:putative nucleotidyltransferase with HDIG domain